MYFFVKAGSCHTDQILLISQTLHSVWLTSKSILIGISELISKIIVRFSWNIDVL